MKTTIISFFLAFLAFTAHAEKQTVQGDSLIIQFGNNTRMVIHAKDKAGIAQLKNYDLNKIVSDMGMTLDSNNRESYIFINEKTGRKYLKDTVLTIRRENGKIQITVTEPKVNARIDTTTVGSTGQRPSTSNDDSNNSDSNNSDDYRQVVRRKRYERPRSGFNINLGLSVYSQNDPGAYNPQDYDLRTIGSRFVSLGMVKSVPLARGRNTSLGLDFGLDVSWYNLMFEGNNTVRKDITGVAFSNVLDNAGQPINFSKSKLTASYLNGSLMPTLAFHRGGFISHLSAGLYAGFRLGSYTKTKTADAGRKERLHSNYYLENLRTGVAVELGIRNFVDLFVNYDLGNLYEQGKGPAVKMVSFGIRL
ncbi:MAG: hypothetical protein EAZ70_02365 [Runella slithyformis]|jgi:hypothetical protein|nr:MAG: hypothetical protein EAY79_02015 [Runella slithyformis]TAF94467.1 MAG: hypothetical protein EAZ46_10175 [Runella sp.]TAG17398.1 MAG: hypothetical protein EAZ38_17430 [Cytophagales bacterium]TAG39016.1 MAG: hypothetical protein EAZ32_10895 [Cytophagia bacterium]TAF00923.1 MAG: hypothetical protein EAZ80_03395 [Runella slithyformis]